MDRREFLKLLMATPLVIKLANGKPQEAPEITPEEVGELSAEEYENYPGPVKPVDTIPGRLDDNTATLTFYADGHKYEIRFSKFNVAVNYDMGWPAYLAGENDLPPPWEDRAVTATIEGTIDKIEWWEP